MIFIDTKYQQDIHFFLNVMALLQSDLLSEKLYQLLDNKNIFP